MGEGVVLSCGVVGELVDRELFGQLFDGGKVVCCEVFDLILVGGWFGVGVVRMV